jgi:MSHA biogenesis protein MshP
MRREIEKGFSLVAAIFLLVVLALMGGLIASVSSMQSASGQLDLQGVRAYQAARAGMEWAAYQVLDPGNATNPGAGASCSGVTQVPCPSSPTNISTLSGSLSGFTVTITCAISADTTENDRKVRVFEVVSTACNQPTGVPASCPNNSPAHGYVSRELKATFSKCKNPSALGPRCSC